MLTKPFLYQWNLKPLKVAGELHLIPENACSSQSDEIKQLKSDLSEIKQLLKQNQSKPDYNKSQYGDKSNAKCYFCKNKGHLKSECEKPKAKLEHESQNQFMSNQYRSYRSHGN